MSTTHDAKVASFVSTPPPQVCPKGYSSSPPQMRPVKRIAEVIQNPRPPKEPKTSEHSGKSVLVCGSKYAGVSWFYGRAGPPPKLCKRVKNACKGLGFKGGDLPFDTGVAKTQCQQLRVCFESGDLPCNAGVGKIQLLQLHVGFEAWDRPRDAGARKIQPLQHL